MFRDKDILLAFVFWFALLFYEAQILPPGTLSKGLDIFSCIIYSRECQGGVLALMSGGGLAGL